MLVDVRVDQEAVKAASLIACLRPASSWVVGWIDFDPMSKEDVQERYYVLLLTRSGRFLASRGDNLKAVPSELFPSLLSMLGQAFPVEK